MFIALFGVWIAYEEYFGPNKYYKDEPIMTNLSSGTSSPESFLSQILPFTRNVSSDLIDSHNVITREPSSWASIRHGCIVFEMLSTAGVFMAIGALTCWHMKLITFGETCVETHINKKERERLQKLGYSFKNPYDLSPKINWQNFLGFTQGKTWRHILLPSKFPPNGDGLTWRINTGQTSNPVFQDKSFIN